MKYIYGVSYKIFIWIHLNLDVLTLPFLLDIFKTFSFDFDYFIFLKKSSVFSHTPTNIKSLFLNFYWISYL